MLFFKKEYRLGLLLILIFGLFLFFIDKTSAQIISYITDVSFRYEQRAFLKMVYIVVLALSLILLSVLDRSDHVSLNEKGAAFSSYVLIVVISFFPGWLIHLYFVIHTIENHLSFTEMEHQFWFYNCADFTLMIGFIVGGVFKLRPAIHDLENMR